TREGYLVVTQELLAVKTVNDFGGFVSGYDSTDPKQATSPLAGTYKPVLGARIRLTLDPRDMSVVSVRGHEKLAKSLAADTFMAPLVKSMLSEGEIKKMADPTWAPFPSSAVKTGVSWKRSTTQDLALNSTRTTTTYSYEGQDNGLDRIRITATQVMGPEKQASNGTASGAGAGKGLALFDRA